MARTQEARMDCCPVIAKVYKARSPVGATLVGCDGTEQDGSS